MLYPDFISQAQVCSDFRCKNEFSKREDTSRIHAPVGGCDLESIWRNIKSFTAMKSIDAISNNSKES